MLVSHIEEIGKMDVKVVVVLRKKSIVQSKEALKDISKMRLGKIQKDNWSMAFQQGKGEKVQKCFFFLIRQASLFYIISELRFGDNRTIQIE